MISALRRWALLLRSVAGDPPPLPADPGAFRDEHGHRRPVDPCFVSWRLARRGSPARVPDRDGADSPEVALWGALARGEEVAGAPDGGGPLVGQGTTRTIEVWTETEFCTMHALGWLGIERERPDLVRRALASARWHLEHTQPDNATQRPWAVQVFALLAELDRSADARLFAETMLHACQVSMAGPDALSGHILSDGAEWLVAVAGSPE